MTAQGEVQSNLQFWFQKCLVII